MNPRVGTVRDTSDGIEIWDGKKWLRYLDGREISRETYSKLFEVIGTAYGGGDGSTTFNLPDLRTKIKKEGGEKIDN